MLGLPSWEQSVKKPPRPAAVNPHVIMASTAQNWISTPTHPPQVPPLTLPLTPTNSPSYVVATRKAPAPNCQISTVSKPNPVHYSMWQGWQRMCTQPYLNRCMHATFTHHTSHFSARGTSLALHTHSPSNRRRNKHTPGSLRTCAKTLMHRACPAARAGQSPQTQTPLQGSPHRQAQQAPATAQPHSPAHRPSTPQHSACTWQHHPRCCQPPQPSLPLAAAAQKAAALTARPEGT